MGRMDINKIKQNLKHETGKITLFDSVDSTSSWLMEHGACGDVCLSETQTRGRGRRGNQWVSPDAGNIYFSMCWCFEEVTEHWSLLGLLVGLAVADTLHEFGLRQHGLKWPNDIFWQDRKLGGILLESQDQSGKVVVGIGLNINMSEQNEGSPSQAMSQPLTQQISQPWVSLNEALGGKMVSRNQIVAKMMNHLQDRFSGFPYIDLDQFLKEWKKWDILAGKRVIIYQNGKEIAGKVINIDMHGRLGVKLENQTMQYFSSAEIKVVSGNGFKTLL